jgi:hypothetical protein
MNAKVLDSAIVGIACGLERHSDERVMLEARLRSSAELELLASALEEIRVHVMTWARPLERWRDHAFRHFDRYHAANMRALLERRIFGPVRTLN